MKTHFGDFWLKWNWFSTNKEDLEGAIFLLVCCRFVPSLLWPTLSSNVLWEGGASKAALCRLHSLPSPLEGAHSHTPNFKSTVSAEKMCYSWLVPVQILTLWACLLGLSLLRELVWGNVRLLCSGGWIWAITKWQEQDKIFLILSCSVSLVVEGLYFVSFLQIPLLLLEATCASLGVQGCKKQCQSDMKT